MLVTLDAFLASMDAFEAMRARILPILTETPGASTRAVSDALGMSESTAAYHLRRMVRAGEARSQVIGRDRCWYARGCALCPVLKRAVPRLRRPAVAEVARALSQTPLASTDIARITGLDRGAVRWASQELERAFLATKTSGGRVMIRDEAEVCMERALSGETCDLWGACAVSKEWRAQLAARPLPSPEVETLTASLHVRSGSPRRRA